MTRNFLFILILFPALALASSCEDGIADDGRDDTEITDGPSDGDGDADGGEGEDPVDEEDPNVNTFTVSSASELEALADVTPGSTVVWKDGEYDGVALTLDYAGTEEAPVTFRAETPGGVTFTGASSLRIDGSHIIVDGFRWENPEPSGEHLIRFYTGSSSCTLENCEVDASTAEMRGEGSTFKWVSLYGTGHTVTACSFNEKKDMGATMVVWLEDGITPRHTISYNRFTRTETIYDSTGEPANEQETIRVGDSEHSMQQSGCIIEHNYFYRSNGEKQEIVSNKSCGNIYRGNAFFESCGTLTLRQGNDCTVSGNFFYGNDIESTGGVRIIGEGHLVENNVFEKLNSVGYLSALCICAGQEHSSLSGYAPVKNATVRSNVFIDCNLAMHLNYGSSSMTVPVESTVIENNIAVTPDGGGYVVRYENDDTDGDADITFSGNTFYGRFRNNFFSLTSVRERPSVDSCLDEIEAVAAAAGPQWQHSEDGKTLYR